MENELHGPQKQNKERIKFLKVLNPSHNKLKVLTPLPINSFSCILTEDSSSSYLKVKTTAKVPKIKKNNG